MATSQIATNMGAVLTHNVFAKNNANMGAAINRVSTGLKINSAKDNASQYAISEKMLERINSNKQANQNVQNDTALMKTAEDGIANTVSILRSLKAHALDAANDSNTDQDRATIQKEVDKLIAQIDSNASSVKFNGKTLLDGSLSETVKADTKALTFAAISTETQATKLNELLGIAATGGGDVNIDVYWTDANGAAQSKSTSQGNGVTLLNALKAGVTAMGTATATAKENATASPIDSTVADASGTNVYIGSGLAVYSTTAGSDNNISGLTMKLTSVKTPTKSYTVSFEQLQMAKDQKTQDTSLKFQIGEEAGLSISANINDVSSKGLNLTSLSVTTKDNATSAIGAIDAAIATALNEQTSIGAMEQRLGFAADTLDTINENLEASNSAIRDADMAKEISNYMKYSVLSQASQYMLAQTHQNAYQLLNLLQ